MAITCLTTQQQQDICEKYLSSSDVTISLLSREFKVSRPTVRTILRNSDIKTRSRSISCRTKKLDDGAFSRLTPEAAYWIGFILADGSVRNNRLSVHLHLQDVEHLKKVKFFLKSNHKITKNEHNEDCTITFSSEQLIKDLKNYGIVENKSSKLFYSLNLDLKPFIDHFIRGVFDGDGSIFFSRTGIGTISITSKNKELLNVFSEYFKKELKANVGIYKPKDRDTYYLRTTSKNLLKKPHPLFGKILPRKRVLLENTIYIHRAF